MRSTCNNIPLQIEIIKITQIAVYNDIGIEIKNSFYVIWENISGKQTVICRLAYSVKHRTAVKHIVTYGDSVYLMICHAECLFHVRKIIFGQRWISNIKINPIAGISFGYRVEHNAQRIYVIWIKRYKNIHSFLHLSDTSCVNYSNKPR